MKAKDIKIGGHYIAKVSGKLTTVRVDAIRKTSRGRTNSWSGRYEQQACTVYDVTNLATGRRVTFRSAAKFRCIPKEGIVAKDSSKFGDYTVIKPEPNTTQFGSSQTGFPEDGGTVGGPAFLPEADKFREHQQHQEIDREINNSLPPIC